MLKQFMDWDIKPVIYMKLGNKLNNSFIFIIVLMLILTAISALYTFKNSINNYLEGIREQEFTKIHEDLTSISTLQRGLNSHILKIYAKNKSVDIVTYDKKNQIIAEYYGLSGEKNNKNYVTKFFNMVDEHNNFVGKMKISYLEDSFLYNQSLKVFYKDTLKNYAIILIFSILVGSVFVVYLSKKIISPISEINNSTKDIRSGIYKTNKSKYNIYELDELQSNLNYLSNTLSLQSTFRKNYAQDIAHELRTPLTNLQLHLEGIRDEIIELDKLTIELLINEIRRLNSMVDNLQITFNNTEKFSELNIEKLNLKNLLNNVIISFQPILSDKEIKIISDFEDINADTDKEKITQVLNNILSNAIKAVDINGKIWISSKKYHNRIVICIKDNGVGISKEDLPHIFERFYRVDSVRNSNNSGHGLGLSITKNLVELLGYNISVNSNLGIGTEFILTITN